MCTPHLATSQTCYISWFMTRKRPCRKECPKLFSTGPTSVIVIVWSLRRNINQINLIISKKRVKINYPIINANPVRNVFFLDHDKSISLLLKQNNALRGIVQAVLGYIEIYYTLSFQAVLVHILRQQTSYPATSGKSLHPIVYDKKKTLSHILFCTDPTR